MRPKRPPLHPQWAAWQPYGGKPSAKVSRTFITPHYSFARCAPNGRHCTHSGPHRQPYGGKPSAKVSRTFITPHYSFARCAPNGRHCTHSGPHGSHMGGNLVPKCRELLLLRTTHSCAPTAATAPTVYGGKPSAKVSRTFITPHYSFARCAPNGRHCTHSGPHGSHMGGNLERKSVGTFITPHYSFAQCAPNGRHCTHSGPHGSHMGGNLAPKCREILLVLTTHSPDAPQTAATAPTVGRTAAIWGGKPSALKCRNFY